MDKSKTNHVDFEKHGAYKKSWETRNKTLKLRGEKVIGNSRCHILSKTIHGEFAKQNHGDTIDTKTYNVDFCGVFGAEIPQC